MLCFVQSCSSFGVFVDFVVVFIEGVVIVVVVVVNLEDFTVWSIVGFSSF